MDKVELKKFGEELRMKICDLVIEEFISKGVFEDVSQDRDKINVLQAVILFDAPIHLASAIFNMSTSDVLADMYKLIIKNTK